MPASWTCSGAGKSGWPMQKLMMSLPWRASALTSARTTKAFSVPRACARLLMSGMGFPLQKTDILGFYGTVSPFRELQAQDVAAEEIRHRMARVARQGDVGAPVL